MVNSVAETWTAGYDGSGGALDFSQTDGSPCYARFDGSGAADIDGSFSMMCWIKADLSLGSEQSIISKGVPWLITNEIDGGWYHLSLKESKVRFMIWDESGLLSPDGALPIGVTWDANTWYHIACVYDVESGRLNTYLDGDSISTVEGTLLGSLHSKEDLTFGSVATGVQTETAPGGSPASVDGSKFWPSNYLGALDEVKLYNVALSTTQIKLMYDEYVNPTVVENNELSGVVITSKEGQIVVSSESITSVFIYTIDGKVITSQTIESVASVSVKAGIYVVIVDGVASKVIVK